MISTKGIGAESSVVGVPKSLQPGNVKCHILDVSLEKDKFKEGAYNLVLNMESEDLGGDFDGFYIDKNDPSLGKYSGQVGKVRASEYAFADGTTKSGVSVYMEKEVLKMLGNICKETGCVAWLESQDNQHDTIQSLVEQFNQEKPYANKYINVCLCGREYTNGNGYTAYDLYLPKFSKTGVPFEAVNSSNSRGVHTFDAGVHIKRKKVNSVESFAASNNYEDVDI